MPSYVITGVSKGLGWEFMDQLSSDPNNTVVGIIRNKPPTVERVAKELGGRKNITLLEADLTDYNATKKAAEDAGSILGGKLDILIANAGYVPQFDAYDGIGTLGAKPEELNQEFWKVFNINVLANIHLYNLFLPLIFKGNDKKVICISSAQGDAEWAREYEIDVAALYSASKAAMNMITSKFHAQYKKDGILFMGICPGMVDVGHFTSATPEQMEGLQGMLKRFSVYAPNFKGPDTPYDSIKAVMKVVNNSTVEKDGGAFLSHFGNKQWI
ncbi:putative short chain dehydrogenase [Lojkania enalia]|uniref:Short chain dehydrogenase n=1 Tax=Lojkania enalia TaxID=147567 RepID=A0A9P4MYS2_9PLEO|nr:putative short chain dehydrogenase [Didymosphaeria enalia]